jgi:hypothetical protein
VRKDRRLDAQQRLLCALHAQRELVAVTIDVLVDGTLDELGLLEA